LHKQHHKNNDLQFKMQK